MLCLCSVQGQQHRPNPAEAFQSAQLTTDVGVTLAGLCQCGLSGCQCIVLRLPILGAQRGLLKVCMGGVVHLQCLVIDARAGLARCPQSIGFSLELLQRIAQVLDAGSRLEQHAADVVGCRQDAGTPFNQGRVIEGIHPVESLRLQTSKPRLKRTVRQAGVFRRAQRVLVALGAVEGQLLSRRFPGGWPFQCSAHSQVRHRMKKGQGRARGYAKKPVPDGCANGGFAGLVGPHDEVNISVARRQRQGAVGEFAVPDQLEFTDAHDRSLLAFRRMGGHPGPRGPSARGSLAGCVRVPGPAGHGAAPTDPGPHEAHRVAASPAEPASHPAASG